MILASRANAMINRNYLCKILTIKRVYVIEDGAADTLLPCVSVASMCNSMFFFLNVVFQPRLIEVLGSMYCGTGNVVHE
jgi:hypothetical protein